MRSDFLGTQLASSPVITLRYRKINFPPPCVIVCLDDDASRSDSTASLEGKEALTFLTFKEEEIFLMQIGKKLFDLP